MPRAAAPHSVASIWSRVGVRTRRWRSAANGERPRAGVGATGCVSWDDTAVVDISSTVKPGEHQEDRRLLVSDDVGRARRSALERDWRAGRLIPRPSPTVRKPGGQLIHQRAQRGGPLVAAGGDRIAV